MQKPFWKKRGDEKKLLIKLKKIINGASKIKTKFIVIPVDNGKIKNKNQRKL